MNPVTDDNKHEINEGEKLLQNYYDSLRKLELTRVQQVLYNIFSLNADLQANWILIEKQLKDVDDKYLIHTIHYYSLIQVCSFLDEYKILETESRTDEKLKHSMYILSPGIRRVRKYKGLQNIRNTMIAHHNRNKMGSFIPYWKSIEQAKYPKSENDIKLILELIIGIGNKLHERHADLLQPAIHKLEIEKKDSFIKSFALENYIPTEEEYLKEKKIIISEIVDREMEPMRERLNNLEEELKEKPEHNNR